MNAQAFQRGIQRNASTYTDTKTQPHPTQGVCYTPTCNVLHTHTHTQKKIKKAKRGKESERLTKQVGHVYMMMWNQN